MSLFQTMYHKITHHFLPEKGQLRVKVRRFAAIMWRLDTSNKENIKKTKMKKCLLNCSPLLWSCCTSSLLALNLLGFHWQSSISDLRD